MSQSHSSTPQGDRGTDHMQGHWLLASLGKRVLRPGGAALSRWLVESARIRGLDVVELAPGLGHTAAVMFGQGPKSYVGIDRDLSALGKAREVVGTRGRLVQGNAESTGLDDACADVVLGEAMLTMQGETGKKSIIAEAARVLRPGGTYAIHELALTPDSLPDAVKDDVRKGLARAIKVNARPLTSAEWAALLAEAGFEVSAQRIAPMALLEPKRIIADEGLAGASKFLLNLLRRPDARARVLHMRSVFREHKEHLCAVAIVARKK